MLIISTQKILRTKATYYRMDNIFGQPTREAKWAADGKKIASGVRNAFRQDVSGLEWTIVKVS
jgi:hypothetical protein